jgi:hypothetical protein
MAEDSGAFKTNLRIRARFRHIIMIRASRGRDAAPLEKHRHGPLGPAIFNNPAADVASILKST